jgi:GNAT superfamily N-acetyltransferase
MEVRRLAEADIEAVRSLRLLALESEPEAFAESVEEHHSLAASAFAGRLCGDQDFVLGAFDAAALVGMVGFYRERRVKRRHIGWIWGMFVIPSHRGIGAGRMLLATTIDLASRLPELRSIRLSVSVTQHHARQLYRGMGFQPFGIEPGALVAAGRYIDEEHMILLLDHSPG